MKITCLLMVLVIGSAVFCPRANTLAQEEGLTGRTITGTAYFIDGRRPGRSLPFTLHINRISTVDEINHLNSSLASGGQDELLRRLSKMNSGRISMGSGVGVTANAIILTTERNGRNKLTVLYERRLGLGELRYGSRSQDYKFGYAELYVGPGANEGMLIPAAFIRLRDGNTWEVEDFGTFPARLMGLRVRGRSSVG
jgi:hypothetical protein